MTAAEVRAARDLLFQKGLLNAISPKVLAAAAKEAARSLPDTLRLIAGLYMGGQGQGPAPVAERLAMVGTK